MNYQFFLMDGSKFSVGGLSSFSTGGCSTGRFLDSSLNFQLQNAKPIKNKLKSKPCVR